MNVALKYRILHKLKNPGPSGVAFATIVAALATWLMLRGPAFCVTTAPSPVEAIDPAITAPAFQLGKAYEAVANSLRPAVVSVFSERIVKYRLRDLPFPFDGDDLIPFLPYFPDHDEPPTKPDKPRQFERGIPLRGVGSGVILDKEGHILTNFHVIGGMDRIKVKLADKSIYDADITGTDQKTDVAVIGIKIKTARNRDFPIVRLGDSDTLRVGDLVLAVGAPFNLPLTVTHGIISATGRSNVGIADYEDFLQTDAAINPGNSGGPLVNMKGEVIGINSAIASQGAGQSSGVGFSIPINMAKAVLPTLLKGGTVTRGQLGVFIQEVTDELAKQFKLPETTGVLVSEVQENSAAKKAGIKSGDIILNFDGAKVSEPAEFRNRVASTAPGKRVKIEVWRSGKRETLAAQIEKIESKPAQTDENSEREDGEAKRDGALSQLGMTVRDLDRSLKRQLAVDRGVLIAEIVPGSPASRAGLQEGDVIVEVNRREVSNAKDFVKTLRRSKEKTEAERSSILLLIKRGDATLFVALSLKSS